jgi:adenylate cyclase
MTTIGSLTVPLASIESCFDGVLPSPICSCSRAGVPNVTYLSIVHRIGDDRVGLANQFFNKTRANIRENPFAQAIVVSPETGDQYRLDLHYKGTEAEGPVFHRMKARLDAVASQTGISHVFALRGVDVYRVLECRPLHEAMAVESVPPTEHLAALERFTETIAACRDLDTLVGTDLKALAVGFGYDNSFIMVPDESAAMLYTLASYGFAASGVGSEVPIGAGIIGIAAQRRVAVRTANTARDALYSRTVREAVAGDGNDAALEREIALPGLPNAQSQLVTPLVARDSLVGVLCLQSEATGRFRASDESVVQIAARHLAAAMMMLGHPLADAAAPVSPGRDPTPSAPRAVIRYYRADHSVFIDGAYLIKGVAGQIFWKLVKAYAQSQQVDFTNREIRLDAGVRMPDFKDNLEARLILLRRRLQDRGDVIRIIPAGRGRFHLEVDRLLALEERSGGSEARPRVEELEAALRRATTAIWRVCDQQCACRASDLGTRAD